VKDHEAAFGEPRTCWPQPDDNVRHAGHLVKRSTLKRHKIAVEKSITPAIGTGPTDVELPPQKSSENRVLGPTN
jgi:hypothetical protein